MQVGFNMRKVTRGNVTIKLWDLAAGIMGFYMFSWSKMILKVFFVVFDIHGCIPGKSMSTLTFHKKSVRALAMHPFE